MSTASLPDFAPSSNRAGISRWISLAYGLVCYAVGVAGLVALILRTLEFIPVTGGPVTLQSGLSRTLFNLGLIGAFGVQHAIMAREGFKRRFAQVLPKAVERSTFTGISGVLIGAIVWLWQPLPELLWHADAGVLRTALLGLCAFGWVYLLTATFAIDHFELFGVKQVWRNVSGRATPEPTFRKRLMYRFDRHPIMTGVLIGIWSAPTMTLDRLVLALGFTAYIIVGVAIEERDLRRKHGDTYEQYAQSVRSLVPPLPR